MKTLYVFSIAVYDLLPFLNQFVNAVPPKIPGSGIKEFVEPVFKVLFIIKGNTPHMVRQRVEKIVIHGCKVQRIQLMLKDLPFKLLECDFDDFVQHEAWCCCEEVWFGLVDGVFSVK